MNKLLFSLFTIYGLISFRCENIVTDVSIDYEEKLIVQGVLTAGKPIANIYISRTLPPLDEYDKNQSIITNADVKIFSSNGEYILHHRKDGYYDSDSILAESGNEYAITIKWKDKIITGKTSIPYTPKIERIFVDSMVYEFDKNKVMLYEFKLEFYSQSNTAYLCGSIFKGYSNSLKDTVTNINYHYNTGFLSPESNESLNIMTLPFYWDAREILFSKIFYENFSQNKLTAFIEAYDPQFYDYWKSRKYSSQSDGLLSFSSGKNIKWNVKGDGFGLFIGRAGSAMEVKNIFNQPK